MVKELLEFVHPSIFLLRHLMKLGYIIFIFLRMLSLLIVQPSHHLFLSASSPIFGTVLPIFSK